MSAAHRWLITGIIIVQAIPIERECAVCEWRTVQEIATVKTQIPNKLQQARRPAAGGVLMIESYSELGVWDLEFPSSKSIGMTIRNSAPPLAVLFTLIPSPSCSAMA